MEQLQKSNLLEQAERTHNSVIMLKRGMAGIDDSELALKLTNAMFEIQNKLTTVKLELEKIKTS